jgi:hypothetical protein
MPKYVPFSGTQTTTVDVSTPTPSPESAREPDADTSPAVLPVNTRAVDSGSVKLVSFTERRAGCSDDREKWTWRVEVENASDRSQYCYVEVEWLDAGGTRIDRAHELRRIGPGSQSITMVHAMDWETADQARTVRVAELQVRSTATDE